MVIARYYVIGLTKEELGDGRLDFIHDFLMNRASRSVQEAKKGQTHNPLHQEIIVASIGGKAAKNRLKLGRVYAKLLYINHLGVKLLRQKGINFHLLGITRELPKGSAMHLQAVYFKKPNLLAKPKDKTSLKSKLNSIKPKKS